MSERKSDTDGSVLTVATWNIHGGRGVDGQYEFSRVLDLIERRDPDVIGIQEVDRNFPSASDFEDQFVVLTEELHVQGRFGGTVVRDPASGPNDARGEYGVAGRRSGLQVLVGDLNAPSDARPIERMARRYDDTGALSGRGVESTRPPGHCGSRIDYVFVTPGVNVIDYAVVDEVASDHLFVETTLEFATDG